MPVLAAASASALAPPPLPAWDGLHPLVVHFPIALAFVAPLFVVLFAAWKSRAREMLLVATMLAAIAAIGACVAVSTGEAAGNIAEPIEGSDVVLDRHEELGELARTLLLVVGGVHALALGAFWKWERSLGTRWRWALALTIVIPHALATLVLANAAHEGGRLVHEFGVRAYWPAEHR